MTDYTELKRLAEAHAQKDIADPIESKRVMLVEPAAVLALIAENERLKTLRSTTERDLAQELEVWKHGPSCWNCGDTGDVHDIVGEWRGKCDCFAAQLMDATQERDRLRAEVAGLRTGYEAYEQVNAELKAENERLERNRDMWKGQVERQAEELTALRKDADRFAYIERDADSGMSKIYGDDWVAAIDAALGQGEQS